MTWIESHQELGQHPKTWHLARELKVSVPAAIGHLHLLWWWALDYAQNGDLTRFDTKDLARASMWSRVPGRFIESMVTAGFLDQQEGSLTLHDWSDYAGRLIDKRNANIERTKRARYANVTHNERARYGATVPNSTVPIPPKGGVVNTTLREWQEELSTSPNKGKSIGTLMRMLKTHWKGRVEGDMVAALLGQAGNDAGYAAKVLWQAIAENPAGDLVQYAMGIVSKTKERRNGSGQVVGNTENPAQKYRDAAARQPPRS